MTTARNQNSSVFEHLRVLEFEDGECRHNYNQTKVFSDNENSIEIFTAEIKPGKWAWGYNLFPTNGRNASRFPSLECGYCRSERDAKLYILGMLLANGKMFNQDAREAIGKAVRDLQQLNLF